MPHGLRSGPSSLPLHGIWSRKRWRTERRWDALDEEAFAAEPVDPTAGQIADLVAQAVQSLPPLQREALILSHYEELSLEEITRAVDAEVGTVKARLSRARENMRRILEPLGPANHRSQTRHGTIER